MTCPYGGQGDFDPERVRPRAEVRFEAFHAANPKVYEGLKRLAVAMRRRGFETYGMKALIEVFRWQTATPTADPEFKINNNHAPYYARLLMKQVTELRGFFEVREVGKVRGKIDGEKNAGTG